MSEEKKQPKTETEQLVDELTGNEQEEPEEPSEKPDEETAEEDKTEEDEAQTEEEVQQEIESYATKSEKLDEQLAEFRAKKLDSIKREEMQRWNYTDEQIERYLKFIEGETRQEINLSVIRFAKKIPNPQEPLSEGSLMNHARQKPKPRDRGEVGKKMFERIKNKVFGG